MTTPNIDTKALRELRDDACKLDGHSLMEVLHAQQKYERAIIAAAPALLDLAERAQEQAKEIERLNAGWQECLDALAIARNTLAAGADERDALRSTVQQKTEQRDALKAEVANWKSLLDGVERINVETRAQRDESRRKLSASEREVERLREALTPSGATKFAYMNEFKFNVVREGPDHSEFVERLAVPWTTIKDIMDAITKRAALRGEEASRE